MHAIQNICGSSDVGRVRLDPIQVVGVGKVGSVVEMGLIAGDSHYSTLIVGTIGLGITIVNHVGRIGAIGKEQQHLVVCISCTLLGAEAMFSQDLGQGIISFFIIWWRILDSPVLEELGSKVT